MERSVSEKFWLATREVPDNTNQSTESMRICFKNESFDIEQDTTLIEQDCSVISALSERALKYFASPKPTAKSQLSLVPEEKRKLERVSAYHEVSKHVRFIVKLLYDMLDHILGTSNLTDAANTTKFAVSSGSSGSGLGCSDSLTIPRQFGQEKIRSKVCFHTEKHFNKLGIKLNDEQDEIIVTQPEFPSTSCTFAEKYVTSTSLSPYVSALNITKELKDNIEERRRNVREKNVELSNEVVAVSLCQIQIEKQSSHASSEYQIGTEVYDDTVSVPLPIPVTESKDKTHEKK